MEKRALGKGINALIPGKETDVEILGKVVNIRLEQIQPNQFQPRKDFNSQSIEELALSIKENGIIQPILVRARGDSYELIAGERRFRAANLLQLKEIPAIIKNVEDGDSLELSLIENIQREDLNSIEEARAYQYLMDKFNFTQEKLSEVLGKARTSIANMLRLLKLPQEIQEEIRKGTISFAHGKTLLELDDFNQQRRLAQEIVANRLSVKELESLIKCKRSVFHKRKGIISSTEPFIAAMEETLQHTLATKVRISKRKKRGHICIDFYSREDLERIVNRIKGIQEKTELAG